MTPRMMTARELIDRLGLVPPIEVPALALCDRLDAAQDLTVLQDEIEAALEDLTEQTDAARRLARRLADLPPVPTADPYL